MSEAATLTPASTQQHIDVRALDDYLRRNVEGYKGPLAVKPLI